MDAGETMMVTVIGTGYVGLVQAVGLAELGNEVVGVDIDEKKVARLSAGESPIYEPGLEELLKRNLAAKRVRFTTDLDQAIAKAEVVFIAVGTPSKPDGSANLEYVKTAATDIGTALAARPDKSHVVVVNKSTVPIGTGDIVGNLVAKAYGGPFTVVSNPEFLREGSAVDDFLHPDRIVLGIDDHANGALGRLEELYRPLQAPVLQTDVKTAELIKYASNAYLATSISFINSIAQIAEAVGADVTQVAEGMKLDARIGKRAFLAAGVGYGGSCFPKDVQALVAMAANAQVPFGILEAAEATNLSQRTRLVDKVRSVVPDLSGATIAVWGLAFKPKTDDMREAPAITVVRELQKLGASITAFDPVAEPTAKSILSDVTYAPDALAAAKDADALVILTDWPEFRSLDLAALKSALKHPRVIDGRNIYPLETMRDHGFTYTSVGRPAVSQ